MGRALASASLLAGVCGKGACADAVAGAARVAWNCSRRVSVVDMMTENCWAILGGVFGLATVLKIGCPVKVVGLVVTCKRNLLGGV